MKKSLITALALVLILGSAAAFAQSRLIDSLKNPELYIETVLGDSSAADGLILTETDALSSNLFWKNTFTFSRGGCIASTEYEFDRNGRSYPFPNGQSQVNVFDSIDLYSEVMNEARMDSELQDIMSFDPYNAEKGGLARAFTELYRKMEPGADASETIRLADYMDWYPLAAGVQIVPETDRELTRQDTIYYGFSPHFYTMNRRSGIEVYTVLGLIDFFRIPMLEDQYAEIQLHRGLGNTQPSASGAAPGGITLGTSGIKSPELGDVFNLYVESAFTEDAAYLWFRNRTMNGKLVDTSYIPGGYGIYVLPRGDVDFVNEDGDTVHIENTVDIDGLRLLYPVDPGDEILHLWAGSGRLLLHRISGGEYIVDVIDAASGRRVQQLDMGSTASFTEKYAGTGELPYYIYWEDQKDFELVWICSSRMILLAQDETGKIVPAIDCELDQAVKDDRNLTYFSYSPEREMLWDGERLAIACIYRPQDEDFPGSTVQTMIFVFREDRLEYTGKTISSLSSINPHQKQYLNYYTVQPFGQAPLTLSSGY